MHMLTIFLRGSVTISQPEHRPWQQVQWHANRKVARYSVPQAGRTIRRKIKDNDELGEGIISIGKRGYNLYADAPTY